MASIRAIQQTTVHQIQSGQVIVDLNSVVKELVENSLDAGATSIEVRFRNHGLDAVEVVDNGSGVSPDDYGSVALKHHTSKLKSYDDLESLDTFGFRGEALASLCALSQLHMVTARDVDAPKGQKLDFAMSGELKSKAVVAAQRGTKVVVEKLFYNLPVRKKELEKNIKREYGKVLSLLQAYACISTGVRFVVSNQMPKASKNVAFSTSINGNTKDNITNVFGVKTLHALVKLDLHLEMNPSKPGPSTQAARIHHHSAEMSSRDVVVQGHISRPTCGEGRQAPDRQFFFVNSRPCGLPQVAKAFNEVYRSFNVSQSPFIFANLVMDTHAYDVNVSPDKRTILLHDQGELLEALKSALLELFESQVQSVPHSKLTPVTQGKLPSYKPLTIIQPPELEDDADSPDTQALRPGEASQPSSQSSVHSPVAESDDQNNRNHEDGRLSYPSQRGPPERLIHNWMEKNTVDREDITTARAKHQATSAPVQNAFDRMRPNRTPAQVAEITIGDKTTRTIIGTGGSPFKRRRIHTHTVPAPSQSLRAFAMAGSQMEADGDSEEGEVEGGEEEEREDDDQKEHIAEGEEEEDGEDTGSQSAIDVESDNETGNLLANTVMADAPARIIDKASIPLAQTQEFVVQRKVFASNPPFLEESSDEDEESVPAADHQLLAMMQPPQASEDLGEEDLIDSDAEYIDEAEAKSRERENIARLVQQAEEAAARPSVDIVKRASQALKGAAGSKYSVLNLSASVVACLNNIKHQASVLADVDSSVSGKEISRHMDNTAVADDIDKTDAEIQLSLTVTKSDFARMSIAGQFNLGFIIATRPGTDTGSDDLFIIDQHAADEKYNFERLNRDLQLDPQRLAQPKQLYLTAVEEEIILAHSQTLTANGFVIETDTSGDTPVGQRCKLLCLPMSRETTFDLSDLEELLHFLSDYTGGTSTQYIPRPTKVRKMLAMRACRSSIMVGKTLTQSQMQKVVVHLGEMDKPWNCPHGRPTMRHLAGLRGWREWNGIPEYENADGVLSGGKTDWAGWFREKKRSRSRSEESESS